MSCDLLLPAIVRPSRSIATKPPADGAEELSVRFTNIVYNVSIIPTAQNRSAVRSKQLRQPKNLYNYFIINHLLNP
jgi:hypothetical protein